MLYNSIYAVDDTAVPNAAPLFTCCAHNCTVRRSSSIVTSNWGKCEHKHALRERDLQTTNFTHREINQLLNTDELNKI